jgi:molybdopterin molybdotransferase
MLEVTEALVEDPAGGEEVRVLKAVAKGDNVSVQGEIARAGDQLLAAGHLMNALAVATCAAVGVTSAEVYRKPAVAVIATGAELRDVEHAVKPHETRNSNAPMLAAALGIKGYEVVSISYVTDDALLIAEYLRAALERSDLVLMTGGMSVGRYDLVAEAIGTVGAAIRFRGVAMTPGRPALFATVGDEKYIFGLPGNPLSAMTGFHEFALPLIRLLSGWGPGLCRPALRVQLARDLEGRPDRQRHVLGRLVAGEGGMMADAMAGSGAGDLVAGAKADGTIILPPAAGRLPAGSSCDFRLWK